MNRDFGLVANKWVRGAVEVNVDKHKQTKVLSVAVSAEAPKGDEPKTDKKKKKEKKA